VPALAAFRIPKRRPKARAQRQPDAQRVAYFAALRPFLARMHERVTKGLLPLLEHLYPDDLRADAAPPRVQDAIQELAKQTAEDMSPRKIRAIARQVAERTSEFQKAQLKTQLVDLVGVDPFLNDRGLKAKADAFVARNTDLIRTVPDRYFEGISQVIAEGVPEGRRAGDLAKDIEERYGVAESDAARIANTEVGQFFGELNQARQEELGVVEFVWETVNDQRVRDSHRDFQGKTFRWDDPPEDPSLGGEKVIPGQAPNCRCIATPVIES
jgi:SPP1 gp7 family putative phage head morphogenesis protein